MYGIDRLIDLLGTTNVASGTDLATRVETAVLDFTDRTIADDTAVVVLYVPSGGATNG